MLNKELKNSDNQVASAKSTARVVDADLPVVSTSTDEERVPAADYDQTTVAAPGSKLPEVATDETTVAAPHRKLPEMPTPESTEPESTAPDALEADAPDVVDSTPDEKKAISMDSEKSTEGKNVASSSENNVVQETSSRSNARVVRAESVEAEEVPTIPLDSLHTLNQLQPEVTVRSVAATRNIMTPSSLVELPSEYRRGLRETLQTGWNGLRPAYLILSLMPAILGSVLAWTQSFSISTPLGHFKFASFVGTLLAIVLVQVGANLINDYYDYRRGVDTSNPFGPGGLIQQGVVSQTRLLYAGLGTLVAGALVGLIVIATSGWGLPLLFGLVGVLCAYFYSASNRSLSSLPLVGEFTTFVLFGPLIVLGAYLVQGGAHLGLALGFSLPFGLFAAAFIHLNNLRDVESDVQAEKRTLATFLNLPLNRIVYTALVALAYLTTIILALPSHGPHLLLITLWTLPTAVLAVSGVLRTDAPANFNLAIHQTLRLLGFFTLWLALALLVLAIWPLLPQYPHLFFHI